MGCCWALAWELERGERAPAIYQPPPAFPEPHLLRLFPFPRHSHHCRPGIGLRGELLWPSSSCELEKSITHLTYILK